MPIRVTHRVCSKEGILSQDASQDAVGTSNAWIMELLVCSGDLDMRPREDEVPIRDVDRSSTLPLVGL